MTGQVRTVQFIDLAILRPILAQVVAEMGLQVKPIGAGTLREMRDVYFIHPLPVHGRVGLKPALQCLW